MTTEKRFAAVQAALVAAYTIIDAEAFPNTDAAIREGLSALGELEADWHAGFLRDARG